MSIEVINSVPIYEIDGEEKGLPNDDETLQIKSHWNNNKMVIIKLNDKEVTVAAEDLEKAVVNATNSNTR